MSALQKQQEFYVYRYLRNDTGAPFYVGKGKRNRARRMDTHNKYCRSIAALVGYEIEYILSDLTEQQALAKEIEFIKIYKDIGCCEANFTTGGDGTSGFRHSEETKRKISISGTGRTYKHTDEAKAKMSKAKKGKTSWNKGGIGPTKGMKFPGRTWKKDPITGRRVWNAAK